MEERPVEISDRRPGRRDGGDRKREFEYELYDEVFDHSVTASITACVVAVFTVDVAVDSRVLIPAM